MKQIPDRAKNLSYKKKQLKTDSIASNIIAWSTTPQRQQFKERKIVRIF